MQLYSTHTCTHTHTQTLCVELVVCDDLTIPNGNVEIEPFGRLLDSVATYRCDPGYGIKGDKTRICREDSNWSGSAPECGKSLLT